MILHSEMKYVFLLEICSSIAFRYQQEHSAMLVLVGRCCFSIQDETVLGLKSETAADGTRYA